MRALNANWLRAATGPLRKHHPGLYASLNRVRGRLLAGGSGLSAYQANAVRRFVATCLPEAAGRRVLEIGSDVEGRLLQHLAGLGIARADGVNPAPELWEGREGGEIELGARTALHRADARALPFDDASFDAIFSVATFEHVLELPRALAEMHRVLRPGGRLYAAFGPIWSGRRGHHLRVRVGDLEARHFKPETNPLPDFCHLLLSRDELRAALQGRCEAPLIEPIVAWVFDDPGINRLFHHQYLESFRDSPFEVVALGAERDPVDPQLAEILRFRYPRERAFDVTNCEAVLARRTARTS